MNSKIAIKKYLLIFLFILLNHSCTGLSRLLDDGDNNTAQYVNFGIFMYLLSGPGVCPTVHLTVEKGKAYDLTLSTESSIIFNISSKDNLPPPNQNRFYYLVVTKDASTVIEFSTLRLCDAKNRELSITSPEAISTATELRYSLEMNDVRTLQNAFYLKLVSGHASVSIRQE